MLRHAYWGAPVRTIRPILLPTALAAALLLGGCSQGGTDDASAAPTEDAAPEETEEPTEEPAEEPEEPAMSGGAACLEGSWTASAEAAEAAALAIPGMAELQAEVAVTGESHVEFAGGTMTTSYTSQVSEISMVVEGQDVDTTTTLDGAVVAPYEATDTDITLGDTDSSGLTAQSTASVNGEVIDSPPVDMNAMAPTAGSSVQYTCDDTTLVLSSPVEGGAPVEQTFSRD